MRLMRLLAALAVVGSAVVFVPASSWAQDEGGAGINGFNLDADANGVGVTFGAPGSAPYPVAAALVPFATSTLSDASGFALASYTWPGPLAGNAGNLANAALPLCPLVMLPVPNPVPGGEAICVGEPSPERQLFQNAINWPVRAEATTAGPTTASAPGMSARAVPEEATAEAEFQQAAAPGAFNVRSMGTTARSALEEGKAIAEGVSVISGITVGDRVAIGSVITEATVASDAAKLEAGGRAMVVGLMVDGRHATIDEKGFRFDEQQAENPLKEVEAGFNDGFKDGGFEIFLTRPVEDRDGDVVSYRSGSLVVKWEIPESGGQTFIVTIGGASATAQASPGFLEELEDGGGEGGGEELPALVLGESVSGGGDISLPSADVAAPLDAPSGTGDGAPSVALDFDPASFFDGISPASMVFALVCAGAIFGALRRLGAAALDRPPVTCPLEGRNP